ncbi:MAG: ATP-grasp domain-containing protein [Candidatus Hydrogenedentes bacterium]|nr:ATP-grasp domain-containing protein [Candidatus Hydrogenedentota bacterium]
MTPNEDPKTRVLIFPCGTEIGLEIHRSLCHSRHLELFGANSVEPNHGAYLFRNYLPPLPMVYDPLFLPCLDALAGEYHIDFIYPAHDDVVLTLARHGSLPGCEVIAPSAETCELCRSKSATYARLTGVVSVPKMYNTGDLDAPFPLFVKPDRGEGSRGARKIQSKKEWDTALEADSSLLSMEYLPGPEYTVDCFTDRHGTLRYAGPRERVRTVGGISMHTRPTRDEQMTRAAQAVNEAIPMRGAWFFQMKRDGAGRLTLLEVAPRVSGGMGLCRNLGVNLPLLSVYDRLGLDVELLEQAHGIEMDRALASRFFTDLNYTHVYLDLDDTLLKPDGVDPLLGAFLFQCRNRGVQLHLLTRHAGDLAATLKKNALSEMFDSVTLLEPGTSKSAHIRHRHAIFIDDSHAERKQVREATDIPVFAPEAIESLLDWRR